MKPLRKPATPSPLTSHQQTGRAGEKRLSKRSSRRLLAVAAASLAALLGGLVYWRHHRPAPALQHYQEGVRLAKEGKGAEAVHEWQTSLRLDPGFLPSYFAIAQQAQESNQLGAAADILSNVARIRPNYPHISYRCATLFGLSNRYETALFYARQAVQQEPDFADAHNTLGKVLENGGDLPGAVEEAGRAHTLLPNDEMLTLEYARLLALTGHPDEALGLVENALPKTGLPLQSNYLEGWLLGEYGRNGKRDLGTALSYLGRALQINPDHTASLTELGILFLRQGNLQAAHETLEHAFRAAATAPSDTRDTLARLDALVDLYAQENNPLLTQAQQTAEQMKATILPLQAARHRYLTHPDDVANNTVLAEQEAKVGNVLDAYSLTKKVLAKDPQQKQALALYTRLKAPSEQH